VDPSLSLQNLVMYISNVPRDMNHVSLIQLYFIFHGMTMMYKSDPIRPLADKTAGKCVQSYRCFSTRTA